MGWHRLQDGQSPRRREARTAAIAKPAPGNVPAKGHPHLQGRSRRIAGDRRVCRLAAMPADDLPVVEFAFPGPLRDQLVAAILAGEKTTTTGPVAEYEHENEPLPVPGLHQVVVDSAGSPVAVIETTAVRVMRLADMDLDHTLAEGERIYLGRGWRAAHEQFWHSAEMHQALGNPAFTIGDDTLVVGSEFRLIQVCLSAWYRRRNSTQLQGRRRAQHHEHQLVVGQPLALVLRHQQRLITLRKKEILRRTHHDLKRRGCPHGDAPFVRQAGLFRPCRCRCSLTCSVRTRGDSWGRAVLFAKCRRARRCRAARGRHRGGQRCVARANPGDCGYRSASAQHSVAETT